MNRLRNLFILFPLLLVFAGNMAAQEWTFSSEKDGIKVYTRSEKDSQFKAFKGEVCINSDVAKVSALVEDVEKFNEWDDDVSEIRVLASEPGKLLRYYVVYDVPWPFQDRDLCVEAVITTDPATGVKQFIANSVPDAVPINDENVRIIDYWQKWIIEPVADGTVHVIIEGFADPAGSIPSWVANMAITKTPLNMLDFVRHGVENR
jgi:hypothetical protein